MSPNRSKEPPKKYKRLFRNTYRLTLVLIPLVMALWLLSLAYPGFYQILFPGMRSNTVLHLRNVFFFALFVLIFFAIFYMLYKQRFFMKGKASGRFLGHVASIPERPKDKELVMQLMADRSGESFFEWQLLARLYMVIHHDRKWQPFVISGFRVDPDRTVQLLGHCAEMRRPAPPKNDPVHLNLNPAFIASAIDVSEKVIQGFFDRLYNRLEEGVAHLAPRDQRMILVGAQMGLWAVLEDPDIEILSLMFKEFEYTRADIHELVVLVLDALRDAGYNTKKMSLFRDLQYIQLSNPHLEALRLDILKEPAKAEEEYPVVPAP
ncbi:MAG: hypothetical protein KDK39_11790 [Leptospiraceae bacterium]|nr:hypothetical protein [Leptospiraceae bacterium]